MLDIDHLKMLVSQIHELPEADWQLLSAIWTPFEARRKEMITASGSKEKYLYFVIDGVQRVYYYDEHGHEATILFMYAPSFGGVLDSFLLQVPSKYYYETLTPSRFLRAGYQDLENLMRTSHHIETMIRKGLSRTLSGLLERLVEIQCFSSEEKFTSLLKRSPHILQLVPHKYLASYLGIDATNFSKLMNKVRI
jgi:CRP-like cAMP-binding protein